MAPGFRTESSPAAITTPPVAGYPTEPTNTLLVSVHEWGPWAAYDLDARDGRVASAPEIDDACAAECGRTYVNFVGVDDQRLILQSGPEPGHTYALPARLDESPKTLPVPFGTWATAAPEEGRLWLWSHPTYYTVGPPKSVRQIDLKGREVGPRLSAPPDFPPAHLMGVLPDGTWLVNQGEEGSWKTTIWDPVAGREIRTIGFLKESLLALVGWTVVVSDDSRVRDCTGCTLVVTDLRTGGTRRISIPSPLHGECGIGGAESPVAPIVGVTVTCRTGITRRTAAGFRFLMVVDPERLSATVVPGSQTSYGHSAGVEWSADGSWIFAPFERNSDYPAVSGVVIAHHLGDDKSYAITLPAIGDIGTITYAVPAG